MEMGRNKKSVTTSIIVVDKVHWWLLTLVGKTFIEKQFICKASKCLSPKYLLTTKGKMAE